MFPVVRALWFEGTMKASEGIMYYLLLLVIPTVLLYTDRQTDIHTIDNRQLWTINN
jgi:hypothetical protein